MRMNISIPDELREQMKPFDEQTNWSAVATAAFRCSVEQMRELALIGDEVKRRLRATEIEDGEGYYEEGVGDGRRWAQYHARMVHLRRLEKEMVEQDEWTSNKPDSVAKVALSEPSARWEDLPGVPDLPDLDAIMGRWLDGFVEGSLQVLDEVKK